MLWSFDATGIGNDAHLLPGLPAGCAGVQLLVILVQLYALYAAGSQQLCAACSPDVSVLRAILITVRISAFSNSEGPCMARVTCLLRAASP
jgi:hypothetical protein